MNYSTWHTVIYRNRGGPVLEHQSRRNDRRIDRPEPFMKRNRRKATTVNIGIA